MCCTGGLITYHRTDGVAIAEDRRNTIRDTISANFPGSLPEEARLYKSKVKNAQEAHDAITVIDPHTMPCSVKGSATERALHQLVWQSTVACQMTDAQYKTVCTQLAMIDFVYLLVLGSRLPGDCRTSGRAATILLLSAECYGMIVDAGTCHTACSRLHATSVRIKGDF